MDKMYSSTEVSQILDTMFGFEPPCCFNDLDECVDEWCADNCKNYSQLVTVLCWKHFLEKGYLMNKGDAK